MKLHIAFSLLLVMLTAACATTPNKPASFEFTNTSWQLVTFQSMDDQQGTTRIDDPARFTITFNSDGSASLRLDCNRGTGSWQSTPSTSGNSGTLKFGPIAATRALCPPPHFDEKLARDLGHVRSYFIKGNRLYMSLMADAGIYEWQRM